MSEFFFPTIRKALFILLLESCTIELSSSSKIWLREAGLVKIGLMVMLMVIDLHWVLVDNEQLVATVVRKFVASSRNLSFKKFSFLRNGFSFYCCV